MFERMVCYPLRGYIRGFSTPMSMDISHVKLDNSNICAEIVQEHGGQAGSMARSSPRCPWRVIALPGNDPCPALGCDRHIP